MIAKILSSFDDKIELLRAENETLEKIGEILFKEWFGKYKVGDDLPNGWKVGKITDIIKRESVPYKCDKNDTTCVAHTNKCQCSNDEWNGFCYHNTSNPIKI